MNRPRVDFFVSNPGHHVEMAVPVARWLQGQRAADCRAISLAGLRGLTEPGEAFMAAGIDFESPVSPAPRRSAPGRLAAGSDPHGPLRRIARRLAWSRLLAKPLASLLSPRPGLAVVPNDAAFPYDHLTALLRERAIPFLLLQEGIRFALPSASAGRRYGAGGATAIAAWGETSARYFLELGVPAERIHLTGSPRFDRLAAPERHTVRDGRRLLLVTNPIDQQGFCSLEEKENLVTGFLRSLDRPIREGDVRLLLRVHAGESSDRYRDTLDRLGLGDRIELVDEPLHALLARCRAVVVMASTVGLEALLLGCSLGVLELPRGGFAHDYVQAGAAVGLRPDAELERRVRALLTDDAGLGEAVESYLDRSLSWRGEAARRVGELALALLGSSGG